MEKTRKNDSSANLGFKARLWFTTDKLRNSMDAAEYKHVVPANGSMTSNQSGVGEISKALIEAEREMPNAELRMTNRVLPTSKFELNPLSFTSALPGQLFYSTHIPICAWFSGTNEPAGKCPAVSELALDA